jgi:hypothetical protein
MTYIAPYQQPDFQQCREHGPEWEPMPSEWGCLRFRNTVTGATVTCPAIWYNLTVEQHCESLRYSIEENKRRRVYWENSQDKFRQYQIDGIDRTISDLEYLITRSIAAGRPLKMGHSREAV